MSKQNQHNVDLVIKKLKNFLQVETDHQLAAILGVSPQVLSNWKSRKRIDYSLIIDFSKKNHINLHWLLGDEPGVTYPDPGENKHSVNENSSSYGQKEGCATCKLYEKVLQQFEFIVHQQGKTIDLLSTELEHLRRLYDMILRRADHDAD